LAEIAKRERRSISKRVECLLEYYLAQKEERRDYSGKRGSGGGNDLVFRETLKGLQFDFRGRSTSPRPPPRANRETISHAHLGVRKSEFCTLFGSEDV
jgi:hypothetical protein